VIDYFSGVSGKGDSLWHSLAWAVVALGICLRLANYLSGCCLWIDECFLAINIYTRSFAGLFRPLDFNQAASLLFILLEKLAVVTFGPGEKALRFFPLLASVTALVLFQRVALAALSAPAACLAIALFALSDSLIYYSTEAKGYSLDVLTTVVCLYAGILLYDRSLNWKHAVIAVGCGTASIFASFSAPFILCAIGVGWWSYSPIKRAGRFVVMGGALMLIFIVWWIVLYRSLSNNTFLHEYWSFAFAPFPPKCLDDWRWYGYALLELLDIYDHRAFYLPDLFFVFLGALALFRRQLPVAIILWVPIAAAIVASCAGLFPFRGRMELFIAPCIPIAIAMGFDVTARWISGWQSGVVAIILISPTIWWTAESCAYGRCHCEIRPILKYVEANCRPGDEVYFNWHASFLYAYYRHVFGSVPDRVNVFDEADALSMRELREQLAQSREISRVWAVRAMTVEWRARNPGPGSDNEVSKILGAWGNYVMSKDERGAAVDLYERRKSP
jgi:hypothetical protein